MRILRKQIYWCYHTCELFVLNMCCGSLWISSLIPHSASYLQIYKYTLQDYTKHAYLHTQFSGHVTQCNDTPQSNHKIFREVTVRQDTWFLWENKKSWWSVQTNILCFQFLSDGIVILKDDNYEHDGMWNDVLYADSSQNSSFVWFSWNSKVAVCFVWAYMNSMFIAVSARMLDMNIVKNMQIWT